MLCNASVARFEAANRRKPKSFLPPSLRNCVVVVVVVVRCLFVVVFLHCRVSTQRRLANVAQRLLVYMFPRGPTYYPERGRRVRWFNRPAWPCAVTSPSVL